MVYCFRLCLMCIMNNLSVTLNQSGIGGSLGDNLVN